MLTLYQRLMCLHNCIDDKCIHIHQFLLPGVIFGTVTLSFQEWWRNSQQAGPLSNPEWFHKILHLQARLLSLGCGIKVIFATIKIGVLFSLPLHSFLFTWFWTMDKWRTYFTLIAISWMSIWNLNVLYMRSVDRFSSDASYVSSGTK